MLTIFLSGDVMTGRGIDQMLARPVDPQLHESYVKDAREYVKLAERKHGEIKRPADDRSIWGFALDVLDALHPVARIINLETAVTTSDRHWKGKAVHYRMSPKNVGCLTGAGIDCATLANNHTLDWGYRGLTETLATLKAANIGVVGAGADRAAANAPAALRTDCGARILVFGVASPDSGMPEAWAAGEASAGLAVLPDFSHETCNDLARRIKAARESDRDLVIVSIHWGGNWGYHIPQPHQDFAHRLIDEADVAIVHGHSSHHVKGIEVYKGRLILYGCGDLITDYEGIRGHEDFRGDLGLLYLPQLDPATGALAALTMQPTQMRRLQLCRPSDDDVSWLRDSLDWEGRSFGTTTEITRQGMLRLDWIE